MNAQIMERDIEGLLHAVIDTVEGGYAIFNITACGSLFSQDKGETIFYDPTSGERTCGICNNYAHANWCDGLTADEIRRREAHSEHSNR